MVEVVVATGVMLVSLSALAYSGTVALTDVGLARQRQAANGLANQTLEQLRALAFDTVAAGLKRTNLAADTNPDLVLDAGLNRYRYRGELVPESGSAAAPPLSPHKSAKTVSGTAYTISTYVTNYNNDATSRNYRATVNVSWANPVRKGVAATVQAQTVLYSPQGCQSTANHPRSGPCDAFFSASATSDPGGITIRRSDPALPLLSGLTINEASLQLGRSSSYTQLEQIGTVRGAASTPGALLSFTDGTATQQNTGLSAVSGTNTDPASGAPAYDTQTAGPASSTVLSATSGNNSLSLSLGAGDQADSKSTVAATGTRCPFPSAWTTYHTDSQLCGSSRSRQLAPIAANLGFGLAGINLGSATVASVGASTITSFTDRDTTPTGSPAKCTGTTGNGCTHARVVRQLGDISLGGLPLGVLAPLGFAGYLVRITGYTDEVIAEAGRTSVAPTVTRSLSISYWVPSVLPGILPGTYGTISVPLNSVSVNVPAISLTVSLLGIDVAVSVSLRTGVTSATQTLAVPGCTGVCDRTRSTAVSESPLIGHLSYVVSTPLVTLGNVDLDVNLGSITADAAYKAPAP